MNREPDEVVELSLAQVRHFLFTPTEWPEEIEDALDKAQGAVHSDERTESHVLIIVRR